MDEHHNNPQFVKGRDRLALAMRLLLEQNDLSHSEMQTFFKWACPESTTWLNRSQISTIRNSKLPKPGPQIFLGIANINLRLAQLAGDDSPAVQALPQLGPLPHTLSKLKANKPFYISNPETQMPMDVGDLFRLFCGVLDMQDERWEQLPSLYDDGEAAEISNKFAVWAQRWMVKQGLIPLEGKDQLLNNYSVKDEKRQKRLWEVVLGERKWKGRELRDEADALRFLVGTLERGAVYSIREFDRWCRGQAV